MILKTPKHPLWTPTQNIIVPRRGRAMSNAALLISGCGCCGYASVWKLDSSLNLLKRIDTGTDARGVAIDSSGNIYVAGVRDAVNNISVWKYNSSGVLVWTYDVGKDTNKIATDGTYVYVINDKVGLDIGIIDATVWKIEPGAETELKYSYDTFRGLFSRTKDIIISSGIAYITSNNVQGGQIWKLDTDGSLLWNFGYDQEFFVYGIRLSGGSVYVGKSEEINPNLFNMSVSKIVDEGVVETWSTVVKQFPSVATIYLDLDSNDNSYVVGSTGLIQKVNSAGVLQVWQYVVSAGFARYIKVHDDNTLYITGSLNFSTKLVQKINTDTPPVLLTSYTLLGSEGYCVDTDSSENVYVAGDRVAI